MWSRFASNTLTGQRLEMVGTAAGCVAEGVPIGGDDQQRLMEAARRVCGLTGTADELQEEVRRAETAAAVLVQTYREEIEKTARLLLEFHEHVANLERKHDAFPV